MKKLYYLLITLMGVCMVACGNDDGVDNSQPKPEVPKPDKITISQQTIEVGFEPDTYSVNVTSPYSWKAESDNDWIIVESPTGIAGTEQLSFSVARNEDEKVRKGTIVVKNSDYNLITEFYITQAAFVPEISIAPKTMNFSSIGGEECVVVTANFTHSATTDADWLSITKTEEGYTLTAPEYLEVDSRTTEVAISNEKYGISEIVNITQSAFVPTELSITPKTLNFSAIGGEECVVVTANFEHSATTDADWLTITKTDDGYTIKASANPELEERTAEVVISNEKYGVSEVANITQAAFVPEISITPKTLNFSIAGGEESIAVTANFEHSATTDADWLTISKTEDGYTITVPEYLEVDSRTAEVVISNEKYNISETIQITQEKPNKKQLIYYTSINSSVVTPCELSAFGANIISNTYKNGIGVIVFDGEVTSIGYRAFYYCGSLTSITIPDSVTTIGYQAFYECSSLTSVTIGSSVTTIGSDAFSDCNSLTSVTIPDSVTTIGDYAFYNCSSLTSVYITDLSAWCRISFQDYRANPLSYAGNLYLNNELVTDLVIPSDVTEIKNYAFNGCRSLTSVTIPDSVTKIGDYAFYNCSSLTSVTIPDSVTTIGYYAFYECYDLTSVTIPDSVTTIGKHTFAYCSSLTSVTIPDSVTTIGDYAFIGCKSLTSVTIPDSVTTIGKNAFYNCSSLTSVTIPDSVTTIGKNAFSGCTGELIVNCNIPDGYYDSSVHKYDSAFSDSKFTSVTIGDSVTKIGCYAFYLCRSLTSVTIGSSVTTIGYDAFDYCSSLTSVYITDLSAWCRISFADDYTNPLYYAGNLYLNNELVTDLVIPSDVTEIKNYAFRDCSSLTSITIPDSVTTIGDSAFASCSSLTSVTIPDSVTYIGYRAFGGCSSLTSVTIPDSVTKIGYRTFFNCSSLTSITIPDSVTTIGNDAFAYCSSLTSVTIPDNVTKIGSYAFAYCSSLTSVYCKAVTPPAGGSEMFYDNASGRKIYVPTESVNVYKLALYWSDYVSAIVGHDF